MAAACARDDGPAAGTSTGAADAPTEAPADPTGLRARVGGLVSDAAANADALRALIAELDAAPDAGDPLDVRERGYARARALLALALGDGLLAAGERPIDVLAEAEACARRAGEPALAAYAADERARLLRSAGASREALAVAAGALALDGVSSPSRVGLAMLAADLAQYLGELAQADAHVAAARAELATLGADWPFAATTREWLDVAASRVARDRGLPDRASALLATAAESARERGAADQVGSIAVELANVWLASSRHALLEGHVERALADPLIAERGDVVTALELCLATSLVVRGRRDADAATRARDLLARLVAGATLSQRDVPRALLRLAEVELALGERAAARAHLDAYEALAEGVGRFEQTLAAMLRAQAASSAPAASDAELAAALAGARAALDELIAELRRDPPREGGTGVLHRGERRGLVSELIALELRTGGEERGAEAALRALFELQALGSHNRRLAARDGDAPTLDDLALDPGVGLLVYLPSIARSHLLTVDADGARHHALPPVAELTAAREDFLESFAPLWAPDVWAEPARSLGTLLLPPDALARAAEWHTVLVVGLDLLRWVPFELLPLDDGSLVGDRFAVGYLPDLPLAARLAARPVRTRPAGALGLALVAAPDFGERALTPIPLGTADRAALERGTTHAQVWSGPRADLAGLVAAAASDATILHVVTHGVADEEGALAPGLALAGEPSVARRAEIEAFDACPPVVILSACRAARGPGRLGEGGLEGVVGALFERGARCVFVAHEDVEYGALLELVGPLQSAILAGATPAAALASAQRAWRAARPDRPAAALLHALGAVHRPVVE